MLLFLVYHKVADARRGDPFTVDPAVFLAHLRLVKESGVPLVDPRRLAAEGSRLRQGVVLTFDDGTADHFQAVRPILEKFSLWALLYVSTERIGRSGYLTGEQIRTLHEEGHTIGSHSHSHRRLDRLPADEIARELRASSTILAGITGERPVHFAPPGGFCNRTVAQAAQQEGYRFLRTMDWGYNRRFTPMGIDVVPMTNAAGMRFLDAALRGEGEWPLRLLFHLKNGIRNLCPGYAAFRSTAIQLFDR